MKLSEILDHIGEHVLDDRTDLASGPPDSLWPDELLVRYLNDGMNIFCRKAWPIIDDRTVACCVINLVTDQQNYPLHSSVLRVLSATPADTDIPLLVISHSLIVPRPIPALPDCYLQAVPPYVDQAGRPGWYTVDDATRVLRIRPAPDATAVTDVGTINLRVARLPILPLDVETPELEPEIPEEYHLDLCDYAVGRALSQPNVGAANKEEGRQIVANFMAKIKMAKNDRLIAQMASGQYLFGSTRTARY